ncbi:uncharacterized protein LOC124420152 [Lucilia cuprina]|uniref:uncharacterized protein LOC124420152 n=1 Tax=Lucilia cuprina TaxID=7375 RepID=UPI001F06C4EF|nr:uncharacterized protein LOC124420152 [Lucilia cuprina]
MVDKELDVDELVGTVNETDEENNESDEDDSQSVEMTSQNISEGLELGRKLGNHFLQYDPNVERALKFQKYISQGLTKYREKTLRYRAMIRHQAMKYN